MLVKCNHAAHAGQTLPVLRAGLPTCSSCCFPVAATLSAILLYSILVPAPHGTSHSTIYHLPWAPWLLYTPATCSSRLTPAPCHPRPLQVYGLPTLILFKDGQEVAGSHREGAVTKAMLQTYLTKHGVVAKANVSS